MEIPLFSYRTGSVQLRPSAGITVPGTYANGGASLLYRDGSSSHSFRGGFGVKWIADAHDDETLNLTSAVFNFGFDFSQVMGMNLGVETEIAFAALNSHRTVEEDVELDNYINYGQLKLTLSKLP